MQKKQIAIIDVGSSKITAVVGERGVNKTFIIKGRYEYEYDGYANGEFFDVDKLSVVLQNSVKAINQTLNKPAKTVYVGVPGDFTNITVKNSQISFSAKKKISEEDVDALFDSAFVMPLKNNVLINRSAIVYELDDFRKTANPIGIKSEILKGKLSFIVCSEYFIKCVKNVLLNCGVQTVECVSTSLAQALYLLDTDTRDRIAVIADVGYISTTLSIIQGDGIVFEKTFPYGGGYITASLTEKLDVDFSVAERLKRKINLSVNPNGSYELVEGENGEYYSLADIKNTILNSLDGLCEYINDAFEEAGFILPEYVALMVTGGGITFLRGAKERLSSRLGMPVRVISPSVPMWEKPTESSVLSLLDIALEQN